MLGLVADTGHEVDLACVLLSSTGGGGGACRHCLGFLLTGIVPRLFYLPGIREWYRPDTQLSELR